MALDLRLLALTTALSIGCAASSPDVPEGFDPEAGAAACPGKCDGLTDVAALGDLPDAPFATLFAPDEPALGLDLALIEAVRAAREADPGVFAEGQNPYSIRYAVYNLRNPVIVAALADAEDAGVDVQILIEKDQLDPDRTWNTSDEFLVSRGFELVGDHEDLDATTRASADLIGISGGGLMHLKTRIYSWRDPTSGDPVVRLTTGSMNPGDLAAQNEETLHYVDDADVIADFIDKYEAVRDDESVTNSWQPQAPLQVLFSPDGGDQAIDRIAELIDAEDELILLAVYSIRDIAPTTGGDGLAGRLIDARQRGVRVVLITDRKQSDGVDSEGNPSFFDDGFEDELRAAGIPVFEVLNPSSEFNAMHTKYGIFGLTHPIVVTDAGNWSRAGLGSGGLDPRNDESVLFIDSLALDDGLTARRYLGNFISILRRYAVAPNASLFQTGGASFAGQIQELLSMPGWPRVSVEVSARAETFFGQSLYLTGDAPELGRWTQDHLGLPLVTSAADYPFWFADPVEMALGARVACKLIKADSGQVTRWESGENRLLDADPTLFRNAGIHPDAGVLGLEMRFRDYP